ncbi:putative glycolipid-binding domain-containing protein [Streptomyces sp. NPDC046557]|uniref:putative glycolipid-binding domain-containing protein n=1 Tax=Streptomyces sp. NPDC046557 TaxID=3155372 RepID=UPI003401D1D1
MARLDTHALVRTWDILPSRGHTTAWAELAGGRLRARGRAVGLEPAPYWLAYELETGPDYVTRRLSVTVETHDTTIGLDLRRDDEGRWTGDGGPRPDLDGALDCDLGLCPLTNTMPVLRHDLHRRPDAGARDFLMAWVSVPDLAVSADRQTYTPLGQAPTGARTIRYESDDFRSDVIFDADGLVVDYPGLATAVPGPRP